MGYILLNLFLTIVDFLTFIRICFIIKTSEKKKLKKKKIELRVILKKKKNVISSHLIFHFSFLHFHS